MNPKNPSSRKAEVEAKVEAERMNVESSLNLDLDLRLVHSLRVIEVLVRQHRVPTFC
jgi:hypothetical protein